MSEQRPVGRDAELADLSSWASAALAGGGGAALVSGDAGIGKTTVVGVFAAELEAAGVLVTVGHCVNLGGSPLPYLPFVEAFVRLRNAVPERVEGVLTAQPALQRLVAQRAADAGGAADRTELFEGVYAGLEQLAGDTGLLLQVEDVHWADQSSLDLLTFLLSRGFTRPVLLVLSYRSDDLHRRHPLRAVLSQWSRLPVRRLVLGPLADGAVRDLVRALDQGPVDAAALQDVVDRAEDNAFFAEELATAAAGHRALPADLSDLLLLRLQGLGDDARTAVRAAAVAGRQVRHAVLAAVVDLEAGALDQALREAIDAQVLRAEGDGYVFRHALLADAVESDLLPGERVRWHAAYVGVLTDTGTGADSELARHALAAGLDDVAFAASVRAGRNALAVGGPDEALAHFEAGLALLSRSRVGSGDGEEVDVIVEASTAAAAAGQLPRAIALVRDGLARGVARTDLDRARLLEALAAAVDLGDYDDPLPYVTEALGLVADGPSALRARVLRTYASSLAGRGRDGDAMRVAEEALSLATELGLVTLAAEVATLIARLRNWLGESDASVEGLQQVVADARARDDPAEIRARYLLGMQSYERGRLAEAVASFRAAADRSRQLGRPWAPYGVDGRGMAAVTLYVQGEWDAVLALTSTEHEPAPGLAAALLRAVGMGVRAGRGDPAAIEDERAVREWRRGDGMIAVIATAAAIDAHGDAADVDAAIATHDEASEFLARTWFDPDFPARTRFGALLVGQLAGAARRRTDLDPAGLLERAAAVVAAGQQAYDVGEARRPQGPESHAWLARLHAEHARLRWLARVEPPGEALVAAWRAAVEAFTAYPHRFELARSQARLAAALRAVGSIGEARTLADAARATAVALGASPLRSEIDALGLGATVEVLTPREAEVLALVAEGLSNAEVGRRLFISTKTVSVHVSNVLAKLGAEGRTEAVAVARRRGLLG